MGCIYFGAVLICIALNIEDFLPSLSLIISDAFTGSAVASGSIMGVIIVG